MLNPALTQAYISIHALREEGDCDILPETAAEQKISIHALREEGDVKRSGKIDGAILFLSTPSARRATGPSPASPATWTYFYPRPPRGGRLCSCL